MYWKFKSLPSYIEILKFFGQYQVSIEVANYFLKCWQIAEQTPKINLHLIQLNIKCGVCFAAELQISITDRIVVWCSNQISQL